MDGFWHVEHHRALVDGRPCRQKSHQRRLVPPPSFVIALLILPEDLSTVSKYYKYGRTQSSEHAAFFLYLGLESQVRYSGDLRTYLKYPKAAMNPTINK